VLEGPEPGPAVSDVLEEVADVFVLVVVVVVEDVEEPEVAVDVEIHAVAIGVVDAELVPQDAELDVLQDVPAAREDVLPDVEQEEDVSHVKPKLDVKEKLLRLKNSLSCVMLEKLLLVRPSSIRSVFRCVMLVVLLLKDAMQDVLAKLHADAEDVPAVRLASVSDVLAVRHGFVLAMLVVLALKNVDAEDVMHALPQLLLHQSQSLACKPRRSVTVAIS